MFCRAFVLIALFAGCTMGAQSFYDPSVLQKIEITFSDPSWDYILDTVAMNSGRYTMAASVKVNGVKFDRAGVKYKGNSSYDSTFQKNPLHIELDTYREQNYEGLKDIKLSNCYHDPSMIREVLAYNILSNYMECPGANFVGVYINGEYMGLYTNTESVTEEFCTEHFYADEGTFIKCNPMVAPSSNTKSNLRKIGPDSSVYFNLYEIKSDYGWHHLSALCDAVTDKPADIAQVIDMDRAIWMLAFDNVTVNLDSYIGALCQNYYLYRGKTGLYSPIVWDLNMCFGGFPFVGSSNSSLASQTIKGLQNLPPDVHATDTYWPLVNAVYSNAQYKRMYIAHMRTLLKEQFLNGNYINLYSAYKALIDSAVQRDTKKFFSYAQFQNALTENYSVGSYSVPGIQMLMDARASYLQGTPDFSAVPPVITGVSATSGASLNAALTITAQVSDASASGVFLGYRFSASSRFERAPMFDDGLHNDGLAGDMVFGAAFTLKGRVAQYYIYAENEKAGVFSPERAEHEFYSLKIEESPATASVKVFPNPATDRVKVELTGDTGRALQIFDGIGNEVFYSRIKNEAVVDLRDFQEGVYVIKAGDVTTRLLVAGK